MKKLISIVLTIAFFITSCSIVAFATDEKLEIKNLKSYCVREGIKLIWDSNPAAEKYVIYCKDSQNKWSYLDETSRNIFIKNNVTEGKIYEFKVQAVNESLQGNFFSTKYCFLKIPKISKVSNVVDGLKIKWDKNECATGYTLMKKIGENGNWKKLVDLSSSKTEYTDKNVQNNVKYYYSLRKKYNNYKSSYYNAGYEKTCVETIKNFEVKNSPEGVTIRWTKGKEVKNYLVFRKIAGEKKWTKVATLKPSKSKYTDKKAKYGKKNNYAIQIISKQNLKSSFSKKQFVYGVNPKKPMIALTYDDGPAASSTNTILNTLKSNNARATFFVLGSRITSYSDTLKREANLGCEIACHTYNHITLTSASNEKIKGEISKTNNLIKKYTGQVVKLARAPGGSQNQRVRDAVGLPMIGWSVDTRDWEHRNSSKSYNCVINNARDGDIVLMHDIHEPTATASKSIIPYLTKKGYQLVTVSEMFDAKGISLKNNGYYYSAR